MANIIKTKSSDIPSKVPKGLAHGELAVNIPDGKLYVGNANGGSVLLNTGKIPPSPTSIADAYVLEIQDGQSAVSGIKYGVKEPSFTDYKEWISTHTGQFPLFVVIKGVTYIAFEYDETHIKAYHFNETTIQSIVSITFGNLNAQFNIRAVNAAFVEKSLGTEAVAEERDRAVKAEQELSSRINENTKAISDGGALRPLYESLPNVKFNEETGFYEVWKDSGGLDDVTPSEMAQIYNYSIGADAPDVIKLPCFNTRAIITRSFEGVNRYNFTINLFQSNQCNIIALPTLSSLNIRLNNVYTAPKLRTITFPLVCEDNTDYDEMAVIENILLHVSKNKAFSISISKSPVLNYTSLRYIPDNVIGTEYSNTTTIVLHATPYTLLSGDATTEQYKATGHTREEWMQIVTDSTAKGITFTKSL